MDELEIARIRTIPTRHLDRLEHFVVEFVSPLDEGLFIINARFGADDPLLGEARANSAFSFPTQTTLKVSAEKQVAAAVSARVSRELTAARMIFLRSWARMIVM